MFKCYNKNSEKQKYKVVIENYNYENCEEIELNGVNKVLFLILIVI